MVSLLSLVACAGSSPEPEPATRDAVEKSESTESSEKHVSAAGEASSDEDFAEAHEGSEQTGVPNEHEGAELPADTEFLDLSDDEDVESESEHTSDKEHSKPDTENLVVGETSEGLAEPALSDDIEKSTVADSADDLVFLEGSVLEEDEPEIDYSARRKEMLQSLRDGQTTDFSDFWSAIDNDPLMTVTLYEEVIPRGTNSLSALGGGSTVSLKYEDTADETVKAAVKPDQDLRQTMYRSEIAYYRLCQIYECRYQVPVTRPVRFSKDTFDALYAASTSKKNAGYRSKFSHLLWEKEDGSKFLYAAYKEWIPSFGFFPIEATSAWQPYLKSPEVEQPDMETFIRKLLAGGRPGASKTARKLLNYLEGVSLRELLAQISDMMLIDYLTNNWDRFSGFADNYGANCHIRNGGLIAIDNGAAFPPWHAPRVVRRLQMVEIFSRKLVTNLRLIDPDALLIRLFPNPTREELKSFERFKERRVDALKYIDELIAEKGEENVLVFE